MQKLFGSFVVLTAAAVLAIGGNSPAAPAPVAASPQVETAVNPLCDCKSCECINCTCTPLTVGSPPDQVALVEIKQAAVIPVAEPKFTEPAKIVPISQPAPKPVAKAAAGHWQTVQSCGRDGCSFSQVWVPTSQAAPVYQQQSACGPGGCGVRRGLFGRRR